MTPSAEVPWWHTAVVYQIYPRSFADGNGDGVGDLGGIRRHLDYLSELGVDAIWLSPIYPSPMADNGYDVSDYCDIDTVFGDLATFGLLLAEAHARGIRVLLDWVANHTSDQHPWFGESRSSRASAKRDWYFWRDSRDGGPPNNWLAAFGGIAWTWDDTTEQWYLHTFLPQQPDLNWGDPAVQEAMHGTLRFWLDRGVDGFRMDVIHMIGKDPALPDAPPDQASTNRVPFNDYLGTHVLLRGIRQVLDSYDGERVSVGEVNLRGTQRIAPYYGAAADELHLVFNFRSLDAGWDASRWIDLIDSVERDLPAGAWPTWVLSNHDVSRQRSRLGGSERRTRALALLMLTLRGTPFLYMGEELGLEDAVVAPDQRIDPAGRDRCRAPMPWARTAPYGWDGQRPWLPFPPHPGDSSVEAEHDDPTSVLALYRRLLQVRRASPALAAGSLRRLDIATDVVAFERRDGDDNRVVVVNFGSAPVRVPVDGGYDVEVASDDATRQWRYDGEVAPETGVVLRPSTVSP